MAEPPDWSGVPLPHTQILWSWKHKGSSHTHTFPEGGHCLASFSPWALPALDEP